MKVTIPLFAALLAVAPALAQATCNATLEQYEALESGDSLSEVAADIGCEGILMSERTEDGQTFNSYIWDGNGERGSNMILLFSNDALLHRQQIGLR